MKRQGLSVVSPAGADCTGGCPVVDYPSTLFQARGPIVKPAHTIFGPESAVFVPAESGGVKQEDGLDSARFAAHRVRSETGG